MGGAYRPLRKPIYNLLAYFFLCNDNDDYHHYYCYCFYTPGSKGFRGLKILPIYVIILIFKNFTSLVLKIQELRVNNYWNDGASVAPRLSKKWIALKRCKKIEIRNIIITIITIIILTADSSRKGSAVWYDVESGSCFSVSHASLSWQAAAKQCKLLHGPDARLAIIDTDHQLSVVAQMMTEVVAGHSVAWVGGRRDTMTSRTWADGTLLGKTAP